MYEYQAKHIKAILKRKQLTEEDRDTLKTFIERGYPRPDLLFDHLRLVERIALRLLEKL
jgi:hypothetical protein